LCGFILILLLYVIYSMFIEWLENL
jgi:hypothetical protein